MSKAGRRGWGLEEELRARGSCADIGMLDQTSKDNASAETRSRLYSSSKGRLTALAAAVVILGGAAIWFGGGLQSSSGAVAQSESRGQAQGGRRGGAGGGGGNVPVEVAAAAKKTIPVRGESLGTVTPMANVAIKS